MTQTAATTEAPTQTTHAPEAADESPEYVSPGERAARLTTPQPPAADSPVAGAILNLLVTAVCVAVASWIVFDRLGAHMMGGDEGHYARVVDRMKATGDWVFLTPNGKDPYFDKPPLGMWLTAVTYDSFRARDDLLLRYRFWSAFFYVATVGLTCLLASAWFRPAIGLVAGLLLATNDLLLYRHGARHGGFDTELMFAVLACVGLYAVWARGSRTKTTWGAIGVVAGCASLLKPMAGVPVLALLLGHALLFAPRRRADALIGAGVAFAACALIAAPWYVAQWWKYGDVFLASWRDKNLVLRMTTGLNPRHVQGPLFFWGSIARSSGPFMLYGAGVAVTLLAAWRWPAEVARRWAVLVVWVAIGWVVLFSFSASKFDHYAYPAYPLFAVAMAVALWWAARRVAAVVDGHWSGWVVPATFAAAVVALLAAGAKHVYAGTSARQREYAPWVAYQALRPAIAGDRMRVVRYGFPDDPPVGANIHFYLHHLPAGQRVATPEALAPLLDERRPTLLLAWGGAPPVPLPPGEFNARVDARFAADAPDFSAFAVDTGPLLSPTSDDPNHPIPVEPVAGTAGRSRVVLAPPVGGRAKLVLRFAYEGGAERHAQVKAFVKVDNTIYPSPFVAGDPAGQSVPIEFAIRPYHVGQRLPIEAWLEADGAAGRPIERARVVSVTARYEPEASSRLR